MDAHAEHAHHHEMPTEGSALTGVAVSATLHCLTGCAIGEVAGVAIGTALGLSNFATIVLAIVLAFTFGYGLTSLPLLRAGLALAAVVPIALASDTLSIATMEVVDNLIIVVIPGAMDAGLGDLLFWGSLSFALAVAFVLTVPVNRWLLARGKGHTAVHETGIHGGPDTRIVGAVTIAAAIFGIAVLTAEAFDGDDDMHGAADEMHMESAPAGAEAAHEEGMPASHEETGVATGASDLSLELDQEELPLATPAQLSFRVLDPGGAVVRDFDVEHTKRMHLIVVRTDLTGFQHLHPRMSDDGTWSTPITLPEAGTYRVFADFSRDETTQTVTADLTGRGDSEPVPLPSASDHAAAGDGYEVELAGTDAAAGADAELAFTVTRDGQPVQVEPYLGADGHLVALREEDLAYLHVHPLTHGGSTKGAEAIRFETRFPTAGRYRLFLQFRDRGEVRTAAFTRDVG